MNIDWKSKLTSRKFWVAVVGFVTPLLLAFGVSEHETAQVTGIIMSGATLVAYILGEGMVDANRSQETITPVDTATTIEFINKPDNLKEAENKEDK